LKSPVLQRAGDFCVLVVDPRIEGRPLITRIEDRRSQIPLAFSTQQTLPASLRIAKTIVS